MLAGDSAGAKTILVKTGAGMDSLGKDRDKWSNMEPGYIAEDILDAVGWLLEANK